MARSDDRRRRRALITGSSRGIGRAVAAALTEAGCEVVVHARRAGNDLDEAARVLGACALTADLADPAAVEMLAELVGDCDILVLNAAHQVRKPWAELSPEDVAVQIGVNFTASFRLAQLLVPPMQARGWGRVVFVGSVQEWRPHPQMPIYSAMKAALSHLQGSLARQVASDGVTVNSVAPGVVETDRTAAVLADSDYRARVLSAIPADRLGTPEDCAAAVAFLCSDAAGFITGANLPVTGGGHLG